MDNEETFLGNYLIDLILVIALALIVIGLARIIRHKDFKSWIRVTATISDIGEDSNDVALSTVAHMKHYFPVMSYTYIHEDKTYTANTVSSNIQNIWVPEYDDWGVPIKEHDRFWYKWKPGNTIDIYIDPKRPNDSVVVKDFSKNYWSHNYALVIGGVLLVIIWFVLKTTT